MTDNKPNKELLQALEGMRETPARDPVSAARGKAKFLEQASHMRSANAQPKVTWLGLFTRKGQATRAGNQRNRSLNPVGAVLVVLFLIIAGTGTTVAAAQSSMPDQALYPLKIWSEDALMGLVASPEARLSLVLELSDRRLTEMANLISSGKVIPGFLVTRLAGQQELALELAAGAGEAQIQENLSRIRLRAEAHLQTLFAMIDQAPQSELPVLRQVQERLMEQVSLCTQGETEPAGFQQLFQRRQGQIEDPQGPASQTTDGRGNGSMDPTGTPEPALPGNGTGQEGGTQSPQGTPEATADGDGPGSEGGTQTSQATPQPTGSGNGAGQGGSTPTPGSTPDGHTGKDRTPGPTRTP